MPSHLPLRLIRSIGLVTVAVIALRSGVSSAQSPNGKAVTGSRAELIARSHAAESLGRKEEAFVLRTRLRDGDFEVGDAIIVVYEGTSIAGPAGKKIDSLAVQSGKILRLDTPQPVGDINLVGVLRSEIEDTVSARVAMYYRNVVVHVTPLLRISVSGAVRIPSVYQARSDAPLSDLLRRAQMDPAADTRNIVIRRGDRVLWKGDDVQSAIADGLTLDGLNLDPGDEIVVGMKKQNAWMTWLPYAASLVSAIIIQQLIQKR